MRPGWLTSGPHGTHSCGRFCLPWPIPTLASSEDRSASSTSLFKKRGQITPERLGDGPLRAMQNQHATNQWV